MMSETGHDLQAPFPAQRETLHLLKLESAQYRELADRHHALALQIARIEGGMEAASDERLEEAKKQRLGMLDDIAAMIAERQDA
jgi:uncharacterized protein YdcH (DUF465 family)